MAFNTLDPTQFEVGRPVRKELWQTVKDNEDDHNNRLNALETVASRVPIFNFPVTTLAQLSNATSIGVLSLYRANQNLSLVQGQLEVIRAGVSGVTTMDVLVGNDVDSLVSVFSVKPQLDFSEGDNARSVNQIFSLSSVNEGQLIALTFDTIQIGMGPIAVNVLAEPR